MSYPAPEDIPTNACQTIIENARDNLKSEIDDEATIAINNLIADPDTFKQEMFSRYADPDPLNETDMTTKFEEWIVSIVKTRTDLKDMKIDQLEKNRMFFLRND